MCREQGAAEQKEHFPAHVASSEPEAAERHPEQRGRLQCAHLDAAGRREGPKEPRITLPRGLDGDDDAHRAPGSAAS